MVRGHQVKKVERVDSDFLEEDYAEDDVRWDALLASEEGQQVLAKLVNEARAEIRAGGARPMVFTADGELTAG